MADSRLPERPLGQHEEAGQGVPEMPMLPPDTLVRGASSPFVLMTSGHRHAIGWHDTRKDGRCFVVTRLSAMDTLKVLDRFPLTEDGWARAWAALVRREPGAAPETATRVQEVNAAGVAQAAERERQTQLFGTLERSGSTTVFKRLEVQVVTGTGQVFTIGHRDAASKTDSSRLLGPLAGAQAIVTGGTRVSSGAPMGMGMTAVSSQSFGDASVVFPDGTVHTVSVGGNYAVREAQLQAVQFNALAGTASPAAPETGSDPAVRLQKLLELRDAGLLTDDEYQAKRAEVINSI